MRSVNQDDSRKSFVPLDKPKSWVVFMLAFLGGVFVGGPILMLASIFEFPILHSLASLVLLSAWATAAVMGCVFAIGMVTGKYIEIQERPWSEQVW